MSGAALEGLRVIELSSERCAYAGKLLADMGRSAAPLRPSPTFSDLRLVSDYRCSNEGRSDEAAALAARYERGFDG